MRLLQRAIATLWLTTGLLGADAVGQTPTISLKAVGRQVCARWFTPCVDDSDCDGTCNFQAIDPTNKLDVADGDVIVAEVHASDWSPNGEEVWIFKARVDPEGFSSGLSGTVVPLGWTPPFERIPCGSDADCPKDTRCLGWDCYGPDRDPGRGAFLDESRTDYIFYPAFCDPGPCSYYYSFGGVLFGPPFRAYQAPPKYCGTLILRVSDNACGTFAIGFDPEETFLRDPNGTDIVPLALEPLTISTPLCSIVGSDPPNCAIDARQPSEPDGSGPAGWDAATIEFSSTTLDIEPTDFSLTVEPAVADPPEIILVALEPPAVTLYLDTTVPPGHWTCFTYLPSAEALCLGYLPGDVTADLRSTPLDITALIETLTAHLRNPLPISQSDVDRSGRSAPADILRIVDLLNGVEAYDAWLQAELPACPSSR